MLTLQPPSSSWKRRLSHAKNNVYEVTNKGKRTAVSKKNSYFVHPYLLLRKICFACLIIFSRSPSLDCSELISFLSKAWGPESLILLWPKGALAGWGIMMELKVCLWNCNKNSHFLLLFVLKYNWHITCMSLRHKTSWLDVCIHGKMIHNKSS